ncbi:MAG TPA: DUF2752 domain-containing protein [Glycomyces sp.]|nr:DUF2752 domain-containing protein [Glycomyces sp.]
MNRFRIRNSRRFAWVGPPAVAISAAGVIAYVAQVDPSQAGSYPTCPFLAITGWHCPGCGSLRMIHALAHGDLLDALSMNLFAVAMLPLLAFWFLRWTAESWGLRERSRTLAHPAWVWTLLVTVCAYWIARNSPPTAFLAPGGW